MEAAIAASAPARRAEVSEHCYLNEIPAFAEAELARLYGHIHSSLAFFRTFRPRDGVNTYVARQDGVPVTLLVFRCAGRRIDVYNEMCFIPEADIGRFARYVFAHFDHVHIISFKGVLSDPLRLPFPMLRYDAKENWEIELPATPEEYTARLGKATRENVKRYRRRLERDHPSFEQQFYAAGEIDEQQVRDILALSRSRVEAKKMKFGLDEADEARVVSLAKECGLVTVLRVGGQICAGTISYCVGSEYLAHMIGHDSRYDAYWVGALCYYTTICESISRGAKKFHMGGGRNEYKTRLLGVRRDMDRIDIYRSSGHLFLHLGEVLRAGVRVVKRKTKVWLLEREKSVVTQSVFRVLHALRKLRGN